MRATSFSFYTVILSPEKHIFNKKRKKKGYESGGAGQLR